MMMPSSMILTICISMVLKRNRGLSLELALVMREHNTKLISLYHLHVMLVLLDREWGVGRSRPPGQKCSVQCGVIFNQLGG